jgi:hypothetical protein
MKEHSVSNMFVEERFEPRKQVDQPYSIKFSINGSKVLFQLKILNKAIKSMYFLVRDNTELFHRLNVGDILNMEYYQTDIAYPAEYLETVIRRITKKRQARLRGHYLVCLDILESQASTKTHRT